MSFIDRLSREKLYLHDETLRDGRQCIVGPNEAIDVGNKLDNVRSYIHFLKKLGVQLVDVGVPVAGGFDVEMAKVIAERVKDEEEMCVTGFARSVARDIDATLSALGAAKHKGISLLTSPSQLHAIKFSSRPEYNGKSAEEVRDLIGKDFLKVVTDLGKSVRSGELSRLHVYIEDSTRMMDEDEIKRLADMVAGFIQAGATDISLPDTMGITDPSQYVDLFHGLHALLGEDLVNRVFWGAHTHNDLSFGVANTMAAARAGLVQLLEGTFGGNGPGEGIGNADLNVLVHQLHTNPDLKSRSTLKDVSRLMDVNRAASGVLGRKIPDTSPIVGSLAPRLTAAGIHQDALYKIWKQLQELKEQLDQNPDDTSLQDACRKKREELNIYTHDYTEFGVTDSKLFSINQLSGRKGLMGAFEERNIAYDKKNIPQALALSGRIAQVQNHRLTDGQLEALAYEFLVPESERPVQCDFSGLEVRKKGGKTVVTFDLVYEEESHHLSAEVSDGSTVSAFTKALDQHFSSLDINITSRFAIKAEFNPEEGRETPDHVPVMVDAKVQVSEGVYTGLVFDTDQDVAGCKAVLFGLNRWLSSRQACKS